MKLLISTTHIPRLEILLKDRNRIVLKVIVNLTEWEITLHLNEFDESWMRYQLGRVSDIIKKLKIRY